MRALQKRFMKAANTLDKRLEKSKVPYLLSVILLLIAYSYPLIKAITNVLSGSIAFWYDPARDLFLASGNLSKITLIGPPSGIPGVFYGPYWIWLLSSAMYVFPEPRMITLLIAVIPFFTIFPILLFRFKKVFGLPIVVIIWLLYILNYDRYATQIWNPYVSPLFLLAIITLITFTDFSQRKISVFAKSILLGVLTGLILNFHISFSIGLTVGIVLYFLFDTVMRIREKQSEWKKLVLHQISIFVLFGMGFGIVFVPFMAFEVRHGFQQTQAALKTVMNPFATVGIQGLSDFSILTGFFGSLHDAFRLPTLILAIPGILVFGYIIRYLRKTPFTKYQPKERLLLLLSTSSICILYLYLTSKNPVWDYHFINVELLFLFMLAFAMKRFFLLNRIVTTYTIVILLLSLLTFMGSHSSNPIALSSLATKEHIVDVIVKDAGQTPYVVYAYNPAIYNYDYSYLFAVRGKEVPYDPGNTVLTDTVYLIIPKSSQFEYNDYIKYRTPLASYSTLNIWKIDDGSTILKRRRIHPLTNPKMP